MDELNKDMNTFCSDKTEQKGDLSYNYFHKQANEGCAPPPISVKLSEEEAATMHRTNSQNSAPGASAWNSAGTWEEKCHMAWVKERLGACLVGLGSQTMKSTNTLFITAVASCSGDANAVLVRGKARHGFDLVLSLSWEARIEDSTIKGTLNFPEISRETVEDDEILFKVSVDKEFKKVPPGLQKVAKGGVTDMVPAIRKQFTKFNIEFKTRVEG
mmetsp:Transcript_4889/g.6633  ORF Transcript_4889/g.6633 Transcript_4889/m.6633 type:complete len:215 (-) Transcript_4889:1064-1708(-)